ncbi:YhdP family protein [Enterobacillus tribolii]|uniref:Uncharacterized protein (TIGR02099 family) n=1 Tax=Enterobacillus tribolii TaxID=1487935 RepID=A0A370QGH4_9GAMM|nr:YhdP family protein [Enterobacillus tribolii]RDK87463.1 uncharacterized protein (TIGR02099 family) [Enterobacillus tribolii]
MRRLPGFLLASIAVLIVLSALLISGLRLILPNVEHFRPQIVAKIEQLTGVPIRLSKLEASWQSFGPTLEVRDLSVVTGDTRWNVDRITVALDVWQSLLHLRWQFRDLTFYRLWVDSDRVLDLSKRGSGDIESDKLSDIFLYQFDHFILRNSRLSFPSPSGARITLDISELAWLNTATRHRAEGRIAFSTLDNQHGSLQVRMDLHDDNGLLSDGKVYLQADRIDVTPWLSRWVSSQTGLDSAEFSLAAWLTIKDSEITGGDMLLSQGSATWVENGSGCAPAWYTLMAPDRGGGNGTYAGLVAPKAAAGKAVRELPLWAILSAQTHCPVGIEQAMWQNLLNASPRITAQHTQLHDLSVDNLTLHVARKARGWQFDIPRLNLVTDGKPWQQGLLSVLYLPEDARLPGPAQQEELRIRATRLQLTQLGEVLPTFVAFLTPAVEKLWNGLQPSGDIPRLALDIPLRQPERTRILADWRDVSWKHWTLLPGVSNFSGEVSGSGMNARLRFALAETQMPYGSMFRAPLDVRQAHGDIGWRNDETGWTLSGEGLDVQAKSLWVNGGFNYTQPRQGEPWLNILAGIRLDDARDAWRYFPEPLMGTRLTDYLSGALEGGKVDNATLVFNGNPRHFPYPQHDGLFEVFVPLRDATFRFQPDWAPLTDLTIDLDFINDGLWMRAPSGKLGDVDAKDVTANIPVYRDEKLLIDASVAGNGDAVHDYFNQSPLANSVGSTLEMLQVGGKVNGRLHLDIPLHGDAHTRATGEVTLADNTLRVAPIASTLEKVSGRFRFDDGALESSTINAMLYGQPVDVQFSTQPGTQDYGVNVGINGNWLPSRLPGVPAEVARQLDGAAPWNARVDITLPHRGSPRYQVRLNADLKGVSSHLPSPLTKKKGEAMPLDISAQGDMNGFTVSGSANKNNGFNSRWLLHSRGVTLDRAVWHQGATKTPELPGDKSIALTLPALDGGEWLALLSPAVSQGGGAEFDYPRRVTLTTPSLRLAGQQWHDVRLEADRKPSMTSLNVKGREVDAAASLEQGNVLRANIAYLYYNPQWGTPKAGEASPADLLPPEGRQVSFRNWPAMLLRCQDCWVMGQRLRKVEADLKPQGNNLQLENGLIDTGSTRLTLSGNWAQTGAEESTALRGKLSGANISNSTNYFGISTPLKDAPFSLDFDLQWQGAPWQPKVDTLNGNLNSKLGKGEIADAGGGRAGQLLRLVSFDALLRKLQLDFSDTFSSGFPFDGIRGTAKIDRGVLTTRDMLVDGLAADIAMNGQIDLVQRKINMEAVVAPEISATVGVATAFAINPVVGAAVFAASKVLAPLWNKISLIRYNITGSLEHPVINEVLRQPKEEKAR